ncbi:uncharacterized protein LOC127288773 [Leptopilina boulardi]|uniref:uncharacterized protein LOC127288773 n=1 Tax=Leptopilina boulardi TaxID=63433 RepID=UPI0021F63B3F|nr:uncharacterized protein LOC127288773 [Leptopilina boulardi]
MSKVRDHVPNKNNGDESNSFGEPTIFIFYDFEAQQDKSMKTDSSINIHKVNLCVAQQVCSWCIDEPDITKPCNQCGLVREFVFKGERKGTFPHLFNTPENESYSGTLPDIKFYSPDTMSDTKRKEFIECEAKTIASACNRYYRKMCLQENTIGIIPRGGYRLRDNHSRKSLEWLLFMERERGVSITHAGRGREYRLIEGPIVDGYYEHNGIRYVFQYHGCFWHGCPECFSTNRDVKIGQSETSMNDRYNRTLAIRDKIKRNGYEVIEIWECQFDREISNNAELKDFFKNHPILKNNKVLNPRDAFYGGRTGNTRSFYEIKEGEKIEYKDICSLYPYICKTGKFPVGHPKLYIGEGECKQFTGTEYDITNVEGLVLCQILPPRDLYHPLLPVRQHGKLMFPLCRTCCETLESSDCTHEDESLRVLEGTWVSDELKAAVNLGYKIVKIYEIWQYDIVQYDPATREGSLLVSYINNFLKIKQEASCWPSYCTDEQSKLNYIQNYEQEEGIKLDPIKIHKNPGLRSVAKLCLNSFWGKFGQRDNLPQTTIVETRDELLRLLHNPEVEINDIVPVNDDIVYVCWVKRSEAITPAPNTTVVIAAYTTTQARLKLYNYLHKLDRRVLYYDTDSCIYVNSGNPTEYIPPVGSLLGDLTDEVEKDYGAGSYINAFISGGPKFYAYSVRKSDGTESTALLTRNNSWSYVAGEKIKPEVSGDGDTRVQSQAAHDRWVSEDRLAKSDLIIST